MNALEAAMRMQDRAVTIHDVQGKRVVVCHLCSWTRVFWGDQPAEHSPDCPVPALPEIIWSLERLEQMQAAVNNCLEIIDREPDDEVKRAEELIRTRREAEAI